MLEKMVNFNVSIVVHLVEAITLGASSNGLPLTLATQLVSISKSIITMYRKSDGEKSCVLRKELVYPLISALAKIS